VEVFMQHLSTRRVAIFAAALASVVVALIGAAASTSATKKDPPASPIKSIVDSLKGLSPAAREQKLYDAAKAEGTLKWYTTLSGTISPAVAKGFETKYPGIKVDRYRASSEDVSARLYQEANAGTAGADIVESNGTELLFAQHRKNILVPYRGSPYATAIPAVYRYDTFTGDRLEYFLAAWNTNLVKGGDEPKSWQDLTNPKWAGKLAMEPSDIDWYAAAYQALENTAYKKLKPKPTTKAAKAKALKKIDAGIDAMFAGIARNSQIVSGHTTQATLLAAGQFAVCVSCHAQSVEALIKSKAPLAFKPFGAPQVIRTQGVAVAYRLQHPNAALLFYDWILRPDGGQKILLDGGANPARPDMADPDLKGGARFRLNLRTIVTNFKFWSDKYDRLMQLGSKKG
jgi:iron(III) transport system substrate-binding protein